MPLPRQQKKTLVQTVSDSQPIYPASEGASDHEYEEIDTIRPRYKGQLVSHSTLDMHPAVLHV